MVGIILPTIDHHYFSRILNGIADSAVEMDYQLVIYQSKYEIEKEMQAFKHLQERLLDGVIILSRNLPIETILSYKPYGPIVLCEDIHLQEIPVVSIKHDDAFKEALNFLKENGHRKIALCLGRREGSNSEKREKVYRQTLMNWGEEVKEEWILDNCYHFQDGERAFHTYMKMENKPTAVLVTNDQVSAGLLLACKKHPITIPEQLALLSFDNDPIAKSLQITTMEIPKYLLGQEAFAAFIELLETGKCESKILPYQLIVRETV
nr:substrate-binding domain-containing protein [Bacillus sp. FJAT-47783]